MKLLKKALKKATLVALPVFVLLGGFTAIPIVAESSNDEGFAATRLIDSPYDFGLPTQQDYLDNPIDGSWDGGQILESLRSFYPEEVPVVMPRRVGGHTVFHVSPYGSDENPGTFCDPFETIAYALSQVEALCQDAKDAGVVVYLHEGVYKIDSTLNITGEMSGSKEFPFFIAAYGGGEVTITSSDAFYADDFRPVTGAMRAMLPEAARDKVRVLNLWEHGITDINEIPSGEGIMGTGIYVYWNDSSMTLARYPNFENIAVGTVYDVGPITVRENAASHLPAEEDDGRGFEFVLLDNRPMEWTRTEGILMNGFFAFEWNPGQYRVREFIENADANSVRTYDTAKWGARTNLGNVYYFFNVFEELDIPGEWYLDRDTGNLYIYPFDDFDTAAIYIATAGIDLINVSGAKHVYFDGLTLTANSGKGFEITESENIVIQNCYISLMGDEGVRLMGSTYSGITSSIIYNTNKAGVRFGGNGHLSAQLIPSRNFLQNSIITRQGNNVQEPGYVDGDMGDIVSHNLFQGFAAFAVRPTGNESIIEYNEIQAAPYEVHDMGSIYAGGMNSPLHINRYNYIHSMSATEKAGNAMYYDAFGSGFVVYGNIMDQHATGFYSHGGRNNIVVGNIISNRTNDRALAIMNSNNYFDAGNREWFADIRNLVAQLPDEASDPDSPYSLRYPMISEYVLRFNRWDAATNYGATGRNANEEWLRRPSGNYVKNNISWNHGEMRVSSSGASTSIVANNAATNGEESDPYVDYENRDLNIDLEGPVFSNRQYTNVLDYDSFETLPFDKMGLITDGLWTARDGAPVKFTERGITQEPAAVFPADASVGQVSYNKAMFKWTDVFGTGRYFLTVSENADLSNPITVGRNVSLDGLALDISTYTISTALEPETTYYWQVEAVPMAKSLTGETTISPIYSFTTMEYYEIAGQDAPAHAGEIIPGMRPITDFSENMWAQSNNPGPIEIEPPADIAFEDGVITVNSDRPEASRIAYLEDVEYGAMYAFGMKLEDLDGWFTVGFQKNRLVHIWQDPPVYCIVLTNEKIELQVYGDEAGRWILTDTDIAGIIEADTWHDYAIGMYPDGDGIRFEFWVDGQLVIDFLDDEEPLFFDSHLVFNAHDGNKSLQLKAATNVSAEAYRVVNISDFTGGKWEASNNPSPINEEPQADISFEDGVITVDSNRPETSRISYLDNAGLGILNAFSMKMEDLTGWATFGLQKNRFTHIWEDPPSYVIVLTEEKIELQVYGDEAGRWILTDVDIADIIEADTWHDYVFGAYVDGDGIRIVLMVDGVTIFDFLDDEEPLYFDSHLVFNVHEANKSLQLRATGE